ncbi:MAG TPA: hypothetical protein VG276_28785 [Actinomycetes bacterium]|nr:hypothetical protein [Actinomycetes bacterium]
MGRLRRLARRVGRRGAALAWFGLLDLVIGWSLLSPSLAASPAALAQYRVLLQVRPLAFWGWVWIAVGLVCLAHVPARSDRLAFAAAIAIKAVWSSGIFAAWVAYSAYRAWVSGTVWATFGLFVLLIAGWPEPRHHGG